MAARVIFDTPHNGAKNMALDEALFLNTMEHDITLRFYAFSPPTLSLGRFQNYANTVNESFCYNNGIDIVRRPTGGRAVLHNKEITYSVVVRNDSVDVLRLKQEIYTAVANAWAQTLTNIGIKDVVVQNKKNGSYFQKDSCFSISTYGEVMWSNKKMAGAAQVTNEHSLLQHGFLLLSLTPDLINSTIIAPVKAENEAIGVFDIIPVERTQQDDIVETIKTEFTSLLGQLLNIQFAPGQYTETELHTANILYDLKYTNPSWTKYKNLDNVGSLYKILQMQLAPVAQQDRARDS